MIAIGQYNTLKISRLSEYGAYLCEVENNHCKKDDEILLPRRYVNDGMSVGDEIRVFVYNDSEDRPVATTETPFATVGQFAFLQTVQVNRVGAFMEWGLQKNLLVPFKEQKIKMFPGGIYLVYVYLDNNSGRVVASARIEKFLGNVFPTYKHGEKVDALVIGRNEIGFQTIVDNLHRGIIYFNETFHPVEIGSHIEAYVKNIRPEDSKIDLTLTAPGTVDRIEKIAHLIMESLNFQNGSMQVTDKTSPDQIKSLFHCSKKDFKKALGMLYKLRKIQIGEENITLTSMN